MGTIGAAPRRALISVYDKTGIVEFARALEAQGIEIVSTGSTAHTLRQAGIAVVEVSEVTGFPEILDGRVKTLHPHIHAGILARMSNPIHQRTLQDLVIAPICLVVGNLYPFAATVASGASEAEIIEQIDIGGPTLIRAAAKNYADVSVVVDPRDYVWVADSFERQECPSYESRKSLACKAFNHIAEYDAAIAHWFNAAQDAQLHTNNINNNNASVNRGSLDQSQGQFPQSLHVKGVFASLLRYGENPHQQAAVYVDEAEKSGGIACAQVLNGKPMSYNNFVDADAAWRAVGDFTEPAAAIIKHANPCGIAIGDTIEQAYSKAHATDTVSAFGGVIAVNRSVTLELARLIAPIFTEVVIAPAYDDEALEVLQEKKNLRIVVLPDSQVIKREIRPISGGFLIQDRDCYQSNGDDYRQWELVAGSPVSDAVLQDLVFAWKAVRGVKSNAILLAKDQAAVGIGMGQVNRVDAAYLAVQRAGERAVGSVGASDAFFPFPDGLEILINAGVQAVVQPGGSMRDAQVFRLAEDKGVSLYITGTRHFAH